MAWLYRRPNSSRWWVGYRHHGRQILQSTGTDDRAEAEKRLAEVQAMLSLARVGGLTRQTFEALTGTRLETWTLKAALADWIKTARGSAGPRTTEKYEALARDLEEWFHATDKGPLVTEITRASLQQFLTGKREKLSAASANMARKCLAVFFRHCRTIGATRDNPLEGIKPFKPSREEKRVRRAFNLAELSRLYAAAPDDFWRYMVLGGFFTGLRLGDLVTMPIGAVDFEKRQINLVSRKTGAALHIPIATPLYDFLAKIAAERKGAKPTDYFWPEHAARYETTGSGWFSQRFYDLLLVKAGLARVRPHRPNGGSRGGKRKVNEVSFHCLRHAYVSTLAALGQNQQVVKALAGHAGDLINDLYTHVPPEVLHKAVAALPDIREGGKT